MNTNDFHHSYIIFWRASKKVNAYNCFGNSSVPISLKDISRATNFLAINASTDSCFKQNQNPSVIH